DVPHAIVPSSTRRRSTHPGQRGQVNCCDDHSSSRHVSRLVIPIVVFASGCAYALAGGAGLTIDTTGDIGVQVRVTAQVLGGREGGSRGSSTVEQAWFITPLTHAIATGYSFGHHALIFDYRAPILSYVRAEVADHGWTERIAPVIGGHLE